MMRFDREQLETLAAVVRDGTFDAAARRLNVTPSAVSQRIKALEQQLGRVVVVRSKPIRATESGAALLRLAQQLVVLEQETADVLGLDESAASTSVVPLAVNADSMATWLLASNSLSPYTTNPLNINPLRDAIAAHVDIDAIRSKASPALYVTVTNVKTGLPRVIANDAMSIDALLASACLPTLFQAVEIDGEPYWDGGYCGNPTLWPMIHNGAARDLVVVQLVPDVVSETPRDATAIRQRIGEIVFNSSLVAEMQAIAAMRAIAERGEGQASVRDLRLHRIGPPPRELIEAGSAGERSRASLLRLHDEGRAAARQFIERHGVDIGVRETLAIARVYSDGRKPKMHTQVPELVVGTPGVPAAAAQPATASAA